mmetsp:Transcript_19506/g.62122  ORF Transcript_19506/g.62122 Transcript_19506/m.62122 type:complete len:277 (+) Transcript_19506:190-1020(+)
MTSARSRSMAADIWPAHGPRSHRARCGVELHSSTQGRSSRSSMKSKPKYWYRPSAGSDGASTDATAPIAATMRADTTPSASPPSALPGSAATTSASAPAPAGAPASRPASPSRMLRLVHCSALDSRSGAYGKPATRRNRVRHAQHRGPGPKIASARMSNLAPSDHSCSSNGHPRGCAGEADRAAGQGAAQKCRNLGGNVPGGRDDEGRRTIILGTSRWNTPGDAPARSRRGASSSTNGVTPEPRDACASLKKYMIGGAPGAAGSRAIAAAHASALR